MNTSPETPATIDFSYPLCDLHRHLDGSVRLQTILDLADQHGIELPADSIEALRPYVQVTESESGLMAFIAKFHYLTAVLTDLDACRRVACENVEDAVAEGIDHVELRFSPWFMAQAHGLDPAGVVEAVIDGCDTGRSASGISVGLIGILSRTYGVETCAQELDAILASRDGFVALDLAGDEKNFPAADFKPHFQRARDAGLHITVHAGEADGPSSVWSAINDLGAERIGHGVRAVEDPRLMDFLAGEQVGLEVCLTSNIHTSTYPSYEEHPVRQLLAQGVLMNLNTDDPGISGIDLPHEYSVAAVRSGLAVDSLLQLQKNGLEMAFLSRSEKERLVKNKQSGDVGPGGAP